LNFQRNLFRDELENRSLCIWDTHWLLQFLILLLTYFVMCILAWLFLHCVGPNIMGCSKTSKKSKSRCLYDFINAMVWMIWNSRSIMIIFISRISSVRWSLCTSLTFLSYVVLVVTPTIFYVIIWFFVIYDLALITILDNCIDSSFLIFIWMKRCCMF